MKLWVGLAIAACVGASGCGNGAGAVVAQDVAPVASQPTSSSSPVSPYNGPLHIAITRPDDPDVAVRAGAAAAALECSAKPHLGGPGETHEAAANPQAALQKFLSTSPYSVPRSGYLVEREEPQRVLFSHDVDGRTKVAVIVSDVVRGQGFEPGWSVESLALCDPAELSAAASDNLGIDVWTDRKGERVATTVLSSRRGAAHCEWQSATFLYLHDEQFVADPQGVLSGSSFKATYAARTALPPDAKDTGYTRAVSALWVAADRSAVYLVAADGSAQRWPAVREKIGCD